MFRRRLVLRLVQNIYVIYVIYIIYIMLSSCAEYWRIFPITNDTLSIVTGVPRISQYKLATL